jgi:hypothetical protein
METQKEYHYTYYSYEEWGRGYFGSRTCRCLPEKDVNYFGSFKDKTFKPTHKVILKSDYNTREEADVDEVILHNYFEVDINPHFANRAKQTSSKFRLPKERASEIALKNKENGLGIFSLTTEQRRENGRRNGNKVYEEGKAIFAMTPEERSELGKKIYDEGKGIASISKDKRSEISRNNGNKAKELGIGVFGRTKEEMIENGRRNGNKVYEEGKGIFAMTPEERSEISKKSGKIGGAKIRDEKLGIFAMTPEERSEHGKKCYREGKGIASMSKEERSAIGKKSKEEGKGIFAMTTEQRRENGRKTASQRWKCIETGFISNASALSKYQKARGIDTSKRIRIE